MSGHNPVTEAGRMAIRAVAAAPRATLLALDYDGTLAPIVSDPEAARPDERAMAALQRLGGLLGHLAIISGRELRSLMRLGAFETRSGLDQLVVLGQYGHERWEAETGTFTSPPASPAILALAEELPGVLAAAGVPDAVLEDKRHSISVHTRTLADPGTALAKIDAPIRELAARHGLGIQPGKFVLEIRGAHVDKGAALRRMAKATGAEIVVFAGDDLGDLPAFAELDQLRNEGVVAVGVCSASDEEVAVTEMADIVCEGPAGIAAWLEDLAEAVERG